MALEGTRNQKANCHPTYEEMIKDAIVTLKKRNGSSQYAIAKFMEEKHKDLSVGFRKYLLPSLKRLVACEKLVKVKGSFKLPPARSNGPKKRVETPKPKPNPKPQSKPKPKETKTTKSTAKANPNPNATPEAPYRPKVCIMHAINARPPCYFTSYRGRPQTKPKPKPKPTNLKAKETKTTAKAKPKPKATAKAKGAVGPKAAVTVTKPKTVVKTKPSAKGLAKAASTTRRTSSRIQALAPKSAPKKATPKKKAAPKKKDTPKKKDPRMNARM